MLREFCGKINRTKKLNPDLLKTPLKRCLTTVDICLLGIGHMIGAGIYVLTGDVAKRLAGPGIILSFILTGFTSLLAALCYAEFGARVPKAGSAYVYTYVTIGEFWAFVIGWNIILEHMIGAASVARAWSGYLDSLFGGVIANGTRTYVGEIHSEIFGDYPDFIAFLVCMLICLMLAIGVKGSTYFNSLFTIINLAVIIFVIIFGFMWANVKNWTDIPGGFLPFGVPGVIAGAATCFYAFIGFDSIATSGEEAKHPERSIPIATFISMAVVTLAYVLVSAALTLMVPYYNINPTAALPDAFAANGVAWAQYIVAIGALAGMTTTMFGGLFALPRCIYAMAADGLLFKVLAEVNTTTQMPVINLVICSVITAFIALLFSIDKLVEFMSIGTLMAYTIVSVSVIVLRYQPTSKYSSKSPETEIVATASTSSKDEETDDAGKLKPNFIFLESVLDCEPGFVVTTSVMLMTVFLSAFCGILQLASEELNGFVWWAVLLLVIFLGCAIVCFVLICLHQQNVQNLSFKVPLVPFIPTLSIFFNVALMTHLPVMTWVRFTVWMVIGLLVYFLYGIRHSRENEPLSAYSALLVSSEATKEPWGTMSETLHQLHQSTMSSKKLSDVDEEKEPIVNAMEN